MSRFEFLQGEGDTSFLLSTGEIHLWALRPVFDFPAPERLSYTGVAKGREEDSDIAASIIQGKNKRAGTVQREELS